MDALCLPARPQRPLPLLDRRKSNEKGMAILPAAPCLSLFGCQESTAIKLRNEGVFSLDTACPTGVGRQGVLHKELPCLEYRQSAIGFLLILMPTS